MQWLIVLSSLLLPVLCQLANYPTVALPSGVIYGSRDNNGIESFRGIPYAEPPIGDLRLRPPVPSSRNLSGFMAQTWGSSCIPMDTVDSSFIPKEVPHDVVYGIFNSQLFKATLGLEGENENCLFVNVFRPTMANSPTKTKLPVMVWIYGGGFEGGDAAKYDPTHIIAESIRMDKPVIIASLNYRSGAFGFLAGEDVKQARIGNLGLLDQRLALNWISDNIQYFGGDPDNVTLFGESAGAISIAHHMVMYDGANEAENSGGARKLFHAAIMQSGSVVPADSVDSSYAQSIYNQFITAASCWRPTADERLSCLRNLTTNQFVDAQRAIPGIFSYHSLALSFLPRYDGGILSAQVFDLLKQGKYTRIPYISGNQRDEGTVFAQTQRNITTDELFRGYLSYMLPKVTPENVQNLAMLYPDNAALGSPFNGRSEDNTYGQYKRMAAFLGDVTFQWPRRFLLDITTDVPRYSFLSDALESLPVLGTFHSSDTTLQFHTGLTDMPVVNAYRRYYVSFAYSRDPNQGSNMTTYWKPYNSLTRQTLQIYDRNLGISSDDFRMAAYQYYSRSLETLLL